MISVTCEVDTSTDTTGSPPLEISSHALDETKVVLKWCDLQLEVSGSDLRTAIENATNTNRYGR